MSKTLNAEFSEVKKSEEIGAKKLFPLPVKFFRI